MKKIILSLSAIIIFSLPFQHEYAQGALFSKVGTLAAKKAIKEVIKDIAIESAMDIAVNQIYDIPTDEASKYQQQQDYEIFCGKKMPDLIHCENPMRIKKILTEADKTAIGNQSEIEFDKLLTNGKGFTPWQKFLDWFLPVWLLSAGAVALTYALDSDTRSLLNEAGYNALVALGIISPITDLTQTKPIAEVDTENRPPPTEGQAVDKTLSKLKSTNSANVSFAGTTLYQPDMLLETLYQRTGGDNSLLVSHEWKFQYYNIARIEFDLAKVMIWTSYNGTGISATMAKNGESLETVQGVLSADNYGFTFTAKSEISIIQKQLSAILMRTPYKIGDFWYTDVLFKTVTGDNYDLQIKHTQYTNVSSSSSTYSNNQFKTNPVSPVTGTVTAVATIMYNQSPFKRILPPPYTDVEPELDLTTNGKMVVGDKVAIIPADGYPYKDATTGEDLKMVPSPIEGGEPTFQKPDGTTVPEDNVTVGDPNVSPDPQGQPQVTPSPTPSNPSPEPIPLTPGEVQTPLPETPPPPPPPPPPPIETLPPVFPEGESCEVGLKLPKISPLAFAVSEAFPFSIPFDLYDGFQAIFSEMGNEKPEFNYKLDFMGEQQEWKISIPDYFDSWKRFTDSFIIFIFDVGIIFMIFRFMGGSK